MKSIIPVILISLLFSNCGQKKEVAPISNRNDYQKYLSSPIPMTKVNFSQESIFWEEKLKNQPDGYTYMQKLADTKIRAFDKTGEVQLLSEIDSLLLMANTRLSGKSKAANLIALSSNSVKQHNFQQALDYAYAAAQYTPEKFGPSLMMFDAAMELGLYDLADRMIINTKNLNSFDYLIRLSKYQDYLGNLDSAIALMEGAFKMVENKDSDITYWAQANLADMYGHAGKIEKSYNNYLEILAKNPTYDYALQGIAWVAFSHDHKLEEAKEIYTYLSDKKTLPDQYLKLAELAEYSGELSNKRKFIDAFVKEASKKKYQGMYNSYLAEIYTMEYENFQEALALATIEVKNRPTPITYALLASIKNEMGQSKEALEIVEDHIEYKTYEPDAILKIANIYLANGDKQKAKKYFLEALDAAYELGPLKAKEIENKLSKI